MAHPPDEDLPPGGELPPTDDSTHARGGFVPEFVRKVAVAGLGAIFMTEEGIRTLAGQLKLPKEALGYILSQAEKTKDEIGRVVSEEIRRFLQSEKLREEFLKLLAGMTVEVKAEVRLKPTVAAGAESKPDDAAPTEGEPQVVITQLSTRRSRSKKRE
jgi:hypothetical protein